MNEIQRQRRNQPKNMEVGVPEAESLLRRTSLSKDEVVTEESKKPEGEEKASGSEFINHLISNLVPAGGRGNTDEEKQSDVEGGKKDEKGGGVLDHIISNLVNPLSPITRTGKNEAFDVKSENEAEGGGGRINNIVSILFHHSEGEVGESKKEKEEMVVKVGGENKGEKTEEGKGGEGGIADKIVSHLPPSIPDDAAAAPAPAPTTDEATILIHIVQD